MKETREQGETGRKVEDLQERFVRYKRSHAALFQNPRVNSVLDNYKVILKRKYDQYCLLFYHQKWQRIAAQRGTHVST